MPKVTPKSDFLAIFDSLLGHFSHLWVTFRVIWGTVPKSHFWVAFCEFNCLGVLWGQQGHKPTWAMMVDMVLSKRAFTGGKILESLQHRDRDRENNDGKRPDTGYLQVWVALVPERAFSWHECLEVDVVWALFSRHLGLWSPWRHVSNFGSCSRTA